MSRVCFDLPPGIPRPQFTFWQSVSAESDDENVDYFGVIVGMDYHRNTEQGEPTGWWYKLELDDSNSYKRISPVIEAHESGLSTTGDQGS